MYLEIDFNSNEAIYVQVRNQIIMEIAYSNIREGDSLPSVRQMANILGINMHTVNKAYGILREEGYIQLDRRRGAVICVDPDKERLLKEIKSTMNIVIAQGRCKNITREDIHRLVDDIFDEY
ncbi:MAG: GntR family transcriptional regulator [Suipraeoptans sp.]